MEATNTRGGGRGGARGRTVLLEISSLFYFLFFRFHACFLVNFFPDQSEKRIVHAILYCSILLQISEKKG